MQLVNRHNQAFNFSTTEDDIKSLQTTEDDFIYIEAAKSTPVNWKGPNGETHNSDKAAGDFPLNDCPSNL